tara:strand:+ start:186 stop:488 length:303 start_codon:yes stop_codon:yes gene_type:complete
MIQTVNEHDFVSAFLDWDYYKDCFSYEGLKSLFKHFEDVIEDTGEQIELDVVAICGEYQEYENLAEIQQDYSVIKSLDDLQEITTVIPVGNTGRVIVWCI